MAAGEPFFDAGGAQHDLRQQIGDRLLIRADIVAADVAALFPGGGAANLDVSFWRALADRLIRLLAYSIREGRIASDGTLADLDGVLINRDLSIENLFAVAYVAERAALDDLALDEGIGSTTEAWPLAAQLVRRASFDGLGAYLARSHFSPRSTAITDRVTTLYTRALFDAALAKEVERASRFGHALSLILFDIDHLSAINTQYGQAVGDKILERMGVLVGSCFRRYDWTARYSDDSVAALLPETDAGPATELAERVRTTLENRLAFVDHASDRSVPVRVSAAIVNLDVNAGDLIDPQRLVADAESALARAMRNGGGRLERVDGHSGREPAPAAS
jgi:diguanylate cyclase (GGDEF)-like protein